MTRLRYSLPPLSGLQAALAAESHACEAEPAEVEFPNVFDCGAAVLSSHSENAGEVRAITYHGRCGALTP